MPMLELPPLYFLIISLVVSICIVWATRRSVTQGLDFTLTSNLIFIILTSGILGARSLHVFYENPRLYQSEPLRVFALWEGGFVYYGGILSAIIFSFWYLKFRKVSQIGTYFDWAAPVAAVGYAVGRWACFFSGCCYGKYCNLPWAIDHRHPTQIYAFLWELLNGIFILALEKQKITLPQKVGFIFKKPGSRFAVWIFLHAIGRIVMEIFRDDFRGPVFYLSISTWMSLCLIGASACFLLFPLLVSKKSSTI